MVQGHQRVLISNIIFPCCLSGSIFKRDNQVLQDISAPKGLNGIVAPCIMANIGLGNGLLPVQHQPITWTNVELDPSEQRNINQYN